MAEEDQTLSKLVPESLLTQSDALMTEFDELANTALTKDKDAVEWAEVIACQEYTFMGIISYT
jgi:hypothetical protein